MERLTRRDEKGIAVLNIKCPEMCEHVTCSIEEGYQCQHQCWRDVLERLVIYEDAEEQGELLWLPCGIGTTVYELENNTDACSGCNDFEKGYCCCNDYCGNKNVYDEDGDIYVSNPQYADRPLCEKHFYEITECTMNNVDEIFNLRNAFGKTIFLTRAEAEVKLKEMEGQP